MGYYTDRQNNRKKTSKDTQNYSICLSNTNFVTIVAFSVLCSAAGAQVEFQRSNYLVAENAGEVEVCVVLRGNTLGNESGTVTVRTQDGSAIGMF